jgi:endonuclease/exonuclease/phosphatase family metal-dependent hydrolase
MEHDHGTGMISGRERFTVMSLNLRFGLADDGDNSWQNRKSAYPALFESAEPDFIGMQEANDFQIDDLVRILPDYRYIGKLDPSPTFWQNNVIFHKKEIGRAHV